VEGLRSEAHLRRCHRSGAHCIICTRNVIRCVRRLWLCHQPSSATPHTPRQPSKACCSDRSERTDFSRNHTFFFRNPPYSLYNHSCQDLHRHDENAEPAAQALIRCAPSPVVWQSRGANNLLGYPIEAWDPLSGDGTHETVFASSFSLLSNTPTTLECDSFSCSTRGPMSRRLRRRHYVRQRYHCSHQRVPVDARINPRGSFRLLCWTISDDTACPTPADGKYAGDRVSQSAEGGVAGLLVFLFWGKAILRHKLPELPGKPWDSRPPKRNKMRSST